MKSKEELNKKGRAAEVPLGTRMRGSHLVRSLKPLVSVTVCRAVSLFLTANQLSLMKKYVYYISEFRS